MSSSKSASFAMVTVADPALAACFTQTELRRYRVQYESSRGGGNGGGAEGSPFLSRSEVQAASQRLGFKSQLSDSDAGRLVEQFDQEGVGGLTFEAFLRLQAELDKGTSYFSPLSKPRATASASKDFMRSPVYSTVHVVNESEKHAYVDHINALERLRDDAHVSPLLPINKEGPDLVEKLKSGVLLCKLVNIAAPGTIDERAMNLKGKLNAWERNENITLCLNSARAIGCQVVNIGTEDIAEGKEHLALALIAQIVKVHLLATVSLRAAPELASLAAEDENEEEGHKDSAEQLLLKWVNHHLKQAGYAKEVKNFSHDLKDGEAYVLLLAQLAPGVCDLTPLEVEGLERAEQVLAQADKIGCRKYLSPQNIVDGLTSLNLAFVANLFHNRNSLLPEKEGDGSGDSGGQVERGVQEAAALLADDDDNAASHEERVYRYWINSVGVSSPVSDIFQDLKDGFVLLEVLDRIRPGCVSWQRAHRPPSGNASWRGVYKKLENCQQVLEVGRSPLFRLSLVGIGCDDIVAGRRKAILSFLWQLMRYHMLSLLQQLRQDHEMADNDILQWANEQVAKGPRNSDRRMDSFKDKSLSSGLFFLELMAAVEPRVVNWDIVTPGDTEEDKMQNARYIVSISRKLGCSTFIVPGDVVKVRPKMILMLTASVMAFHLKRTNAFSASPSFSRPHLHTNGSTSGMPPLPSPGRGGRDRDREGARATLKFEDVVKSLMPDRTPAADAVRQSTPATDAAAAAAQAPPAEATAAAAAAAGTEAAAAATSPRAPAPSSPVSSGATSPASASGSVHGAQRWSKQASGASSPSSSSSSPSSSAPQMVHRSGGSTKSTSSNSSNSSSSSDSGRSSSSSGGSVGHEDWLPAAATPPQTKAAVAAAGTPGPEAAATSTTTTPPPKAPRGVAALGSHFLAVAEASAGRSTPQQKGNGGGVGGGGGSGGGRMPIGTSGTTKSGTDLAALNSHFRAAVAAAAAAGGVGGVPTSSNRGVGVGAGAAGRTPPAVARFANSVLFGGAAGSGNGRS